MFKGCWKKINLPSVESGLDSNKDVEKFPPTLLEHIRRAHIQSRNSPCYNAVFGNSSTELCTSETNFVMCKKSKNVQHLILNIDDIEIISHE